MTALAVGLMSGTSLDGLDAALVRIVDQHDVELLAFRSREFEAAKRSEIMLAISNGSARDLALLDVRLGELFADAALTLLESAGRKPAELSFVATHGQTVWHEPGVATLQLGNPAVIAERLGVRVVSDFRSRDVAAGGQGAPLVPIADVNLFGHADHGRALLNIGGMANVTWVPRRGLSDGVIAFDTGPGMAVIDAAVRELVSGMTFDAGGELASCGNCEGAVVSEVLDHPFFRQPPPKSTGREEFGVEIASSLIQRARSVRQGATVEDCLATAVEVTARSIAMAVGQWLPQAVGSDLVVSGGGARNSALMNSLAAKLSGWSVNSFDEEFFDGDAKEAVAFAYLGWLALAGKFGNVPGATGAKGPRILGSVTPS